MTLGTKWHPRNRWCVLISCDIWDKVTWRFVGIAVGGRMSSRGWIVSVCQWVTAECPMYTWGWKWINVHTKCLRDFVTWRQSDILQLMWCFNYVSVSDGWVSCVHVWGCEVGCDIGDKVTSRWLSVLFLVICDIGTKWHPTIDAVFQSFVTLGTKWHISHWLCVLIICDMETKWHPSIDVVFYLFICDMETKWHPAIDVVF